MVRKRKSLLDNKIFDIITTHYIFEGLSKSYNVLHLKNMLSKDLNFIRKIRIDNPDYDPDHEFPNTIRIFTSTNIDKNNFDKLNNLCFKLFGWKFIKMTPVFGGDLKSLNLFNFSYDYRNILFNNQKLDSIDNRIYMHYEFIYEAKFSTKFVETFNADTLYHIIDENKFNKIYRQGLVPKSYNIFNKLGMAARQLPRIYLNFNLDEEKYMASYVIPFNSMLILRINPELINKLFLLKRFYRDPASKHGIFTYENIPPKYLQYLDRNENKWKNIRNEKNRN